MNTPEAENRHHSEETTEQIAKVLIAGEINDDLFRSVAPGLLDAVKDEKVQEIWCYLNTSGGNGHIALALYDIIRNSPKPVTIVGLDRVMSTGLIVLSAATNRLATPNTRLMFHQADWSLMKKLH